MNPSNAINGTRATGTYWSDFTQSVFPDWLQVTNGSKSIGEVYVFSLQDESPVEPTPEMTFTSYGVTAFNVAYWNGSSWAIAASVTGNNKVWRKVTFSPVTTTSIRVVVNGASDGWSRIVELEAYEGSETQSTQTSLHWLVPDQLGTPRIIFDEGGSLANTKRHDYLPFGEELFAPAGGRTAAMGYSGGDDVRQQFTAKERDVETGLDYFKRRHYSSVQGRFTSADVPFADQSESDPQSWNLYIYAGNNPLIFTDPFGLWKWVDPEKNGKRFIQWEEGDNWDTLSEFLYTETGRDYYASDLKKAYASGGLGPDTILDFTGAPKTYFTNNRGGVENVTFQHLSNLSSIGRGAKAARGILGGIWGWAKGRFAREATKQVVKKTIKEISEELGYFPSDAVNAALKGRGPLQAIPAAERELAARFYERVANEVVSGAKEAAARALNLARAKFLRDGGTPPVDIHGFEP